MTPGVPMIAAPDESFQSTTGAARASTLTPEAVAFLTKLANRFETRRRQLLEARVARQREIDDGWRPDFPAETAEIRQATWTVALIPADLMDRRVEITGPTSRKMVINALNSVASVFM